jgi:branched-chain amino acid transport system substrate-binding protein
MRRYFISAFATCAAMVFAAGTATAQDTVNVGFVLPMTGQLTSVGKQVSAGAQLYIQQHGNSVAGKKIEFLIRDDSGVPDVAKRDRSQGARGCGDFRDINRS